MDFFFPFFFEHTEACEGDGLFFFAPRLTHLPPPIPLPGMEWQIEGGIEGPSPPVELVIAQTRALIHAAPSRTEQSGGVGGKGQPLQERGVCVCVSAYVKEKEREKKYTGVCLLACSCVCVPSPVGSYALHSD